MSPFRQSATATPASAGPTREAVDDVSRPRYELQNVSTTSAPTRTRTASQSPKPAGPPRKRIDRCNASPGESGHRPCDARPVVTGAQSSASRFAGRVTFRNHRASCHRGHRSGRRTDHRPMVGTASRRHRYSSGALGLGTGQHPGDRHPAHARGVFRSDRRTRRGSRGLRSSFRQPNRQALLVETWKQRVYRQTLPVRWQLAPDAGVRGVHVVWTQPAFADLEARAFEHWLE